MWPQWTKLKSVKLGGFDDAVGDWDNYFRIYTTVYVSHTLDGRYQPYYHQLKIFIIHKISEIRPGSNLDVQYSSSESIEVDEIHPCLLIRVGHSI